jgi:predicted transcriptional regulator
MATGEQVIRAPAQLGVMLRGVRQQQGLSQQDLALKVGGTSQARLSQLELQPGASEQPKCPAGADGR